MPIAPSTTAVARLSDLSPTRPSTWCVYHVGSPRDSLFLKVYFGESLACAFSSPIHDSPILAGADPCVRVIVVTGSGRAFCAGADMGGLKSISTVGAGQTAKKMVEVPDSRQLLLSLSPPLPPIHVFLLLLSPPRPCPRLPL